MTKNYAVIANNTVINVIVADSKEIAEQVRNTECVECDGSFWIGWTRSGKKWIAPVEETPVEQTLAE
jgi:hypothetical protein